MMVYRIDYRKEDRDTKHLFVVADTLMSALAASANILGSTAPIQCVYRISDPDDCVLVDCTYSANVAGPAKR